MVEGEYSWSRPATDCGLGEVTKFEKEEIELQNETNLVLRLATYNVMTLRNKDVGTGQRGEDRKAALLREQFASG